jgi:hypothetical protein
MESESYRDYNMWGHAILQQKDILQPERYAGSGTITKSGKLIEASGVLGHFDSEEDAQHAGLIGPAPGSTRTGEATAWSASLHSPPTTSLRTSCNSRAAVRSMCKMPCS